MDKRDLNINQADFLAITEELLKNGKRFSFRARGGSMSPFIKDGDTVLIEPLQGRAGVGDVVLVKTAEGRAILHRIAQRLNNGIVTRSDVSSSYDDFTPAENILGRVIHVSGRGFNFHLKYPLSYLIGKRLIYTPALSRIPLVRTAGKILAGILG